MPCQEGAARETEESRAISKWSEGCEQERREGHFNAEETEGTCTQAQRPQQGSSIQRWLLERKKRQVKRTLGVPPG